MNYFFNKPPKNTGTMKRSSNIKTGFLAILLVSFLAVGCSQNCIEGNGSITTQSLDIPEFSKINLEFSSDVSITQGKTQEVRAIGHANIIDNLKTTVRNDTWFIDLENGCYKDFDLEIQITLPNIERIAIDGSGDIVINDFTDQRNLDLRIDGSGDIRLNKMDGLEDLNVKIDGSGSITAVETIEQVKEVNIDIDGSGDYMGYNLDSEHCHINISGSGNCEVSVSEQMEVVVSGSGDVYYRGNPNINQNISGSGNLINAN